MTWRLVACMVVTAGPVSSTKAPTVETYVQKSRPPYAVICCSILVLRVSAALRPCNKSDTTNHTAAAAAAAVSSLLLPSPFRRHLRQENNVWEGGAYTRVAVPTPDSDGSGTSAVNVTLAVALSLSLVAAIVIAGVAAKFIQRKVRQQNRQLSCSVYPPLRMIRFGGV